MKKPFKFFLSTILVWGALYSVAISQERSPQISLNSNFAHVMLWTDNWVPAIKFFTNKELRGKPAYELNADGLFQGNTLLCQWPGGRIDINNSPNMVLGYSESDMRTYRGCGNKAPILSTWGDGGIGTAVLYIRVDAKRGSIVRSVQQGKTFYFDLNTIPKENWKLLKIGDDFRTVDD